MWQVSNSLTHTIMFHIVSLVSRESARILFLASSPNESNLLAAEISNYFLNSEFSEWVCFQSGPEFNI